MSTAPPTAPPFLDNVAAIATAPEAQCPVGSTGAVLSDAALTDRDMPLIYEVRESVSQRRARHMAHPPRPLQGCVAPVLLPSHLPRGAQDPGGRQQPTKSCDGRNHPSANGAPCRSNAQRRPAGSQSAGQRERTLLDTSSRTSSNGARPPPPYVAPVGTPRLR